MNHSRSKFNGSRKFYAHSLEGEPKEKWHKLEDHLKNTAELSEQFAGGFNAGDWGFLAGIWHDIGKYSIQFQEMLDDSAKHSEIRKRVDHSAAGGRHATATWHDVGKILAYVILGHHSGLPNGKSTGSDLSHRLSGDYKIPDFSTASPEILSATHKPKIPFVPKTGLIGFQLSFFIRMLFSCIVDADFLDTERFLDPDRATLRDGLPTLSGLKKQLFEGLSKFKADSHINRKRAEIFRQCMETAESRPGLFSLTVPTGGGKTLSSLAFAMKHAIKHGMNRIIYVIPFTSIIEQNAQVFRSFLGNQAVIEHHSNYVPDEFEKDDEYNSKRHRMACENWDAPLIVTTNVQFFESLFAYRTSRCRKVHNIANSVIILDEAQMLPEPYLLPCLETVKELTDSYHCSVVLCTATQPALKSSKAFPYGLPSESIMEIVSDPNQLHDEFKRVRLNDIGVLSDEKLAGIISEQEQALCIVNTRQRANDLFNLIKDLPGVFHLSARMCPVHRTKVLGEIREALEKKDYCRVVSTQLIEAGVDIDFPQVYREIAGLDSIAQAAGRCNREGSRKEGDVFVYRPVDGRTPRLFRQSISACESVIRRFEDVFSPVAIEDYFRQVFWLAGEELDKKQILVDLERGARSADFPFRDIGEKFNLIETQMIPIIIPWDYESSGLIKLLERTEYPRSVLRRLQPYTVQIYAHEFHELERNGAVKIIDEKYPALISAHPYYKDDLGICADLADIDPEDLIF